MRPFYRQLVLVPSALLLSVIVGCSTAPEREMGDAQAAPSPQPAPPEVELSAELLYQLLVAEFSGQQGALRLSAAAYLETARATQDFRLARRATRIAVYARQNAIALEAARLWVKLDPANDDAHKSAAAMLIASGQLEAAHPHLEKLLESPLQDADHGYQLVATLLANSPHKEQAQNTMEELVRREPNAPYALYAQALLANQLDDQKTAEQILTQLLQNHPNHSQGLVLQARVKHLLGDQSGSLKSMDKAVRLSPDNHQLRLTYARMLVEARQLPQAREQFSQLAKSSPNDADITYALGLLALEAGDLDEAEKYFNRLLQHQQREEESRFAMAQIAEARQQPEKAIQWFSSITQGERYLDAQLQAVRLLAQHQGLSQARQHLHQLSPQSDSEQVELYLADAQLLSDAEQYDAAMAIYNDGLQQFTDNEELLYARAITAEKIDRLDILERDLRRILQLAPDNTRALNALGYTLADRTTRFKEAYEYIKRAYQQRPDDIAILDSMGWVLYRLGRTEEAIEYLQRALDQLLDDEIAAHLGEVLWSNDQKSEARSIWSKALKKHPDSKVLQQTIQRFNP